MKYLFLIFACSVLSLSLSGQVKVTEKSSRKKPGWVDGMKEGFVITSGAGPNLNIAKEKAFAEVKAQISSAVAVRITSSSLLSKESVTRDNISSLYEKINSTTKSETAKRDFLHGISQTKVKEYYWEKYYNKKSKEKKYVYYILYPFSTFELISLVEEFKKKEMELTLDMQKSLDVFDNFTAIEQIQGAVIRLKKYSEIFQDSRKTKCLAGIEKGRNLLASAYIRDLGSIPGEINYEIKIGEKTVTTSKQPSIKSNCARIVNTSFMSEGNKITYTFDECYDEPGNYVKIAYRLSGKVIEKDFLFDTGQGQVGFKINGAIQISEDNIVIPIVCYSEAPFDITKVVFETEEGKSQAYTQVHSFSGKGQKEIILSVENTGIFENVRRISGNVFYTDRLSGESKMSRMYRQDIVFR